MLLRSIVAQSGERRIDVSAKTLPGFFAPKIAWATTEKRKRKSAYVCA
jgi:hypothetical protein